MVLKEQVIAISEKVARWCVYGIVFLVPIYFAWLQENYSVFDLSKSLVLHLFLGIGLLSWLVATNLKGNITWRGNRLIGILGILVAGIFLISTIFSLHPMISLWGSYERMQGLYNLWHYLGFAFLILVVLRDRQDVHRVIMNLLLGSALASIYGVIQVLNLDPLGWSENVMRIFSTFGQPNFFGHYLSTLIPLTVYAIIYLSRNIYLRLSYSILLCLQMICLLFTYSRGAWLAIIVILFLFTIFLLWRQGKKKIIGGLVLCIVALIIALNFGSVRQAIIASVPTKIQWPVERLLSIIGVDSAFTNKIRLEYWQAGIEAIKRAPLPRQLFGYGPDVQASVFISYYKPYWAYYEQMNSFPDRAHNFIIDIILQFGLVGLSLLSILIGYIIYTLYILVKNEKSGREYWLGLSLLCSLAIYTINNLFSFSLTAMNVVFYSLLAITWLVGNQYKSKKISLSFFQPLSRWLISGFFISFLFLIFYNYTIKFYIADYYYFKAKKAEVKNDCSALLKNMDQVLIWYPVSHFYNRQYLNHGINCFSAINSEESIKELGDILVMHAEAIPEREQQFYTLVDMSHMYSILGFYVDKKYYLEAEKLYQKMLAMNPYITSTYQDYGRMKLWERKNDEAIAILQKGLDNAPSLGSKYPEFRQSEIASQVGYFMSLIGMAYSDKGDYKAADEWYTKAITVAPSQTAAYKNSADLHYQLGDITKAITYNEKALAIDPNNSLWSFALGTLYKELGNISKAYTYASQAVQLSPEDIQMKRLLEEIKSQID